MQDPGLQKKNKKWYQKLFPRKKSRPLHVKKDRIDSRVRLVIRPLRIFQFLVVLLIFILIIYTIMLANTMLSSVMCILLIVLSGVYLFVLSMDLINLFMGDEPYTIPMFIFSFLGSLLFGAAGIFLIAAHMSTAPWYILTIAFISLFAWILFIIDVSLIMAFWKRNCNLCQECSYLKDTNIIHQRDTCHPLCTETVKYDLTTSVSSVKVPYGDECATPDHSHRKTREAHRRQYVDCPTSARVLNLADAADIQTDIRRTTNAQSQTQQQVKEAPVQTVSKCELCNRQIQIFGAAQSTNQPDCTPCPALVKLLSGTPCCPGCRCVTGIIQVSQQSQQRQTQRLQQSNEQMEPTKDRVLSADEKPGNMLTSNEHHPQDSKVTGTVTKVTLASYCLPSKKANASCQTNTGETTETTPIKDKKSDEQQLAKRLKASITERRDKEREKSDARKKNDTSHADKARKRMAENATKKAYKSSTRQVSESVAEKPMENSKHVATEPSQASSAKEASLFSAEKLVELPEKELSGNSAENPAESSKENVPQNTIHVNKPEEAAKIGASESTTDELDRVSKNSKNSSTAKILKFRSKDNFSSGKPSESHDEKTNATGTKTNSPGPSTVVAPRPKGPSKDGGKKMLAPTYSVSKLRVHSVDSSADTSSNGASSVALDSSKKTADNGKVSDDGSNSCTARSDLSTVTKAERSQETDAISKPNTETQTAVDPRRKKTYAFKRKNKVQPGGTTYAEIDVQTCGNAETNASTNKSQDETLVPKKSHTVDDDAVNICPSCKRVQMPTTSSSFQYYDIHRDKQGRMYCEYCAPSNSVKVLHKKDDQKHLKCARCGQSLPVQSSQRVQATSDNCPNCGQGQVRVQ